VAVKKSSPATPGPRSAESAALAPESLIAHLQETIADIVNEFGAVERRRMLRSDGWFVKGKAFTLVSRQGRIIVRLSDPAAQDQLLALPGAAPWQIRNKSPMRGWPMVPESMHEAPQALQFWLKRAYELTGVATTPKKKASRKKSRPQARTPTKKTG
jgi:TfoX/Sxy family transcriptional regulator of competence genes